ncbi:MAG: HAD-IA family hydrolase [Nitratireductor sp.]
MDAYTIIFDLDGTLAHTGPDLLESLNHSIAPLGLEPLQISQLGHLVGHGSLAMIQRAFALSNVELSKENEAACQERFLEFYAKNIAKKTKLFDGSLSAIQALKNDKICVCTNKQEYLAKILLNELGITHLFSSITGGDSFEFRKPDPRHLFKTIELANGNKDKAIMIGDTITDTSAAQNANIPVIVVDFGYSDVPIESLGADAIISHFDELYEKIEKIKNAR